MFSGKVDIEGMISRLRSCRKVKIHQICNTVEITDWQVSKLTVCCLEINIIYHITSSNISHLTLL